MKNEALKELKKKYPDLYNWMKGISRYGKIDNFVKIDYKKDRVSILIYTKNHRYRISARHPKCKWVKGKPLIFIGKDMKPPKNDGYLGCTVMTRKPRAGEDWNRGNDLTDGAYSYCTFESIIKDIIKYELVKVVNHKFSD